MKCRECERLGLKSRVYPHGSMITLMHCPFFYDEDGKGHCHDPNTTTTEYSCSKGHSWTESCKGKCWCGWDGNKEDK